MKIDGKPSNLDDDDDTPPTGITLDFDIDMEELEKAFLDDMCDSPKKKKCLDCKGKKRVLLLYTYKDCPKCEGTGEVSA